MTHDVLTHANMVQLYHDLRIYQTRGRPFYYLRDSLQVLGYPRSRVRDVLSKESYIQQWGWTVLRKKYLIKLGSVEGPFKDPPFQDFPFGHSSQKRTKCFPIEPPFILSIR